MLKLLKQEDFAILLVHELVASKQLVSLSEIGKAHGVSVLFLKKLARLLKAAGIIKSREGLGGGYSVSRDPKTISVLEIMEAVEEKNSWNKTKQIDNCPLAVCSIQNTRKTIIQRIEDTLRNISIYELATP